MGDLCRWLLDNGDEAWIVASKANDLGMAMLYGQCGVPPERCLWMSEHDEGGRIEDWVLNCAEATGADLIDHQWWGAGIPKTWNGLPVICTLHGYVGLPGSGFYDAVLSVEDLAEGHQAFRMAKRVETIWNWVNLEKFPFREELPREGAVFVGRAFKTINAKKVAWLRPELQIDCYGTAPAGLGKDWPPNMKWLGYEKPENILWNYRVVFASAIAAMEAVAAGRLVIAGQNYANRPPWGALVTPDILPALSRDQFASKMFPHDPAEATAEQVLAEYDKAMSAAHTEMRRECRAYIEQEHSKDRQCRKIRDLYEEVLT